MELTSVMEILDDESTKFLEIRWAGPGFYPYKAWYLKIAILSINKN